MAYYFPKTTEELMSWGWKEMEPIVNDLLSQEIKPNHINDWVAGWSDFNRVVSEIYNRLYVDLTAHTNDKMVEQRFMNFMDTIYPKALQADQKLKEKLLASGLSPDNFDLPLKKARVETELFREENIPLLMEEEKLNQEYNRIISAQTVLWEGQEITTTGLRKVFLDSDRSHRVQAWQLIAQRQLADRQAINDLWAKQLELRLKMASNANYSDYRSFRWQQLQRFDYTPNDSLKLDDAIEKVVVPAARRVYKRRRQRMGVPSLRPWDLMVDPNNRPALKPFSTIEELKQKSSAIFHQVDPELEAYFKILDQEGLLDLENRINKAPGAYCAPFIYTRRPFIFSNAVGLQDDVQTLLHESGHAFHGFESSQLPYIQQLQIPMEFAEVASMGMELLAGPFLSQQFGGFYSPVEAARAVVEHLEGLITFWPYMAVVDTFQHWVYKNPNLAMDSNACDAAWSREWERFMVGQDWDGLDQEKVTGWQRKLHIHTLPFYYFEYGVAQLGAVQIWQKSIQNHTQAVAAYRKALALGGTVSLPELFRAAGARLSFDVGPLKEAVNFIEQQIEILDN